MARDEVIIAIDAALAVIKDIAITECLKRVENAQREYLLAEAKQNREKTDEIIRSIRQIDLERMRLEATYSKVKNSLGDEGNRCIEVVLKSLEKKRKYRVSEKNDIMK